MKKVVIVSSTPRVEGNSEVLAKQFMKGAQDAGHVVDFICLRDYELKYCRGCYACYELGKCFQEDGMNELANKLLEADVIVFATPVYFYSMSGQLKVFIDRLVPMYTKLRADVYMIVTAWDSHVQNLEATVEAIRGLTRDCMENCEEKGVLYGAGLNERKEAYEHEEYLEQAYLMGKNC